MRLLKALRTIPLLLGLMISVMLAHHSVTKEFDQTKAVTIQGVITKVEWVNPHAWITLEAKVAKGQVATWHLEIAAAAVLFQRGILREDLELAKRCSVEIWPARDGTKTAYGRKLTFADGKSFDIHDRTFDPVPLDTQAK